MQSCWKTVSALLLGAALVSAKDETNYDESKVPAYELPDPLIMADKRVVADAGMWNEERRPELLRTFANEVYGKTPDHVARVEFKVVQASDDAFDGEARLKRVLAECSWADQRHAFEITIYLPQQRPAPVFVGMMLFEKTATQPQPGRSLAAELDGDELAKIDPAELPGAQLMQTILSRGYGVATLTAQEIAPDNNEHYRDHILGPGGGARQGNDWGAIGAWAWALSRAADYFATDPDIDPKRIAAIGHSRNGKTALWAGAQDERFSLVISNNSGCAGAALSKRRFGETVRQINERFPYWFCPNFSQYNEREQELPVDQHQLLALIAPRLLYVGSAVDDNWADPKGEFLATVAADPVFRLLGQPGLGTDQLPKLNQPIGHSVGYHLRSGKHALTDYDWMQYLKFADRHWRGESRENSPTQNN